MKNLLWNGVGVLAMGAVAIACASDAGEPKTRSVRSALSQNLVIAGVYGGGGNSGAVYTHDYIILFNRGSAAASLNGLSLQYDNAAGNFSATSNVVALPNASLQPGQYF